jgi:hypothetical protein
MDVFLCGMTTTEPRYGTEGTRLYGESERVKEESAVCYE